MNGESEQREFCSYHPKNGQGTTTSRSTSTTRGRGNDDEEDWLDRGIDYWEVKLNPGGPL